jgi:hypothetical protein
MRSMKRTALTLLAATTLVLGASVARAAPMFADVPGAFGKQPCNNQGCWTNYMTMADLNGDGALDVIFPNAEGFFSKGGADPLVIYFNDGKANFTDASQSVMGYTGWLRQVAIGDVDGDGDLDLYAPAAWGDADSLFINDGKGHFTEEAAARIAGLHSHAGAARFGDVDGDGDLDLFLSDGWAQSSTVIAHLYLNDGKGNFTDATAQLPTTSGGEPIDFDLVDVDGDLDLDLVIDMHQFNSQLWINDGKGHFSDGTANLPAQHNLKYDPVACDVDGDGDLDLIWDNAESDYTEQLLINDGTGKFTDETAARIQGNVGADDNGIACVDIDGDGDFDLAVASLSDDERIFINDGTGHFSLLPAAFPSMGDSTLWFDFADLDGDGRLDCVTAQGESGAFLNKLYLGIDPQPVDKRPPTFRAVEDLPMMASKSDTPAVRFAVSDNATSDQGPRLKKAYVRLKGASGDIDVPAVFSGGDLFRAVLPAAKAAGDVEYAACATDAAGNDACAPAKKYHVTDSASSSSSGGGASSTSTSTSTSTSGAGGSGETPATPPSSGCGCSVPGREDEGITWFAAGICALFVVRYRRKMSRD